MSAAPDLLSASAPAAAGAVPAPGARGVHVLPDLIVGGAQKSGTTTLHHLLAAHPEIYFPPQPQEIHFFDRDANYRRGLGWYASLFAGWRGERVVAQTSPLYLYEPNAAPRIRAARLEARFVFLLRHPADRAWSHYWHEVKYGWERLPFREAIVREPERIGACADARRHFSYLDRGRYARQLRHFLRFVPRERVLVQLHDELEVDPIAVARRCAAFAGVAADGWSPPSRNLHRNAARLPRFPALQRIVRRARGPLPSVARLVDRVNLRTARPPALDPALRAELTAGFEPELRALEALTGLDLRRWREATPERAS